MPIRRRTARGIPNGSRTAQGIPIRSRTALLGAGACVALLGLDWIAAFRIAPFQRADQSIFLQFVALHAHGPVAWTAGHLVARFTPGWYLLLVLVPLGVALARGRRPLVLAVLAIVLGANATTELLKPLLATPRPGSLFVGGASPVPPASWPSGHATAVMSLVLATVLVAPARFRPVVAALGGALAIGVGYSVLADGMHYPSDVIGGFLVAATWALCTVAALLAAEGRRPSARTSPGRVSIRAALGPTGAVLVAAVALAGLLIALRPHDVVSYADAHPAFVVGAAGIAALGLTLSTGVLLSVRR